MARIATLFGSLGFWLALLGALGILLSPIGYRLGLWDAGFALRKILTMATIAAVAALVLCVLALLLAKIGGVRLGTGRIIFGLALSALLAGYVLLQLNKVKSLPYIHDITTDTANPPTFVALADARKAAPNGLEYKGAEIADKQKQAYPDITPLVSKLPPNELFAKAEAIARASAWEIATADAAQGRIEATQTTLLYGFKDDVVIRITTKDGGSQLDMRSMSRVGQSDVGVNAKRIREFIAKLGA